MAGKAAYPRAAGHVSVPLCVDIDAVSLIELARWADVVLIAPATAEIMARLASGAAADLLTTLCLATEAPIAIAPAMNHVMWGNPAVQSNRETLEQRGVTMLGPDVGSQACGETGAGRMLDPDDIAALVFGPELGGRSTEGTLSGKTVLVTAGPTREPIDPVRYITNRSSGKMGFAMAQALEEQGAEVTLVAGPSSQPTPPGVARIDVESALGMHAAVMQRLHIGACFNGRAVQFIGFAAQPDVDVQKTKAQVAAQKTKIAIGSCSKGFSFGSDI